MRGRVVSGRGDLARWMTIYASSYEQATGARLHPGSLNVALDEPWVMTTAEARLEADAAGVGMGFVTCRLNGVPCWIVRTDRNNEGRGDHPLTLVEVVAAAHLRTQLDLHDGDEVALHVEPEHER